MTVRVRWLGPALAVGLAGCAAVPEPATGPEVESAWQEHRERVAAVEQWSLVGRVAVRRGDEGWSAQLRWRQRGARYDLRLSAPLGQGGVRLEGGPDGVVVRTSRGDRYAAEQAGPLLARWIGGDVPVEALRYWVRGLPQPGVPVTRSIDAQGRLIELHQRGWSVEYDDYTEAGDVALPRKLTVRDDELRVRLVIDRWSLDDPQAARIDG